MIDLLRSLIGTAQYRFAATLSDAPAIVNCWTLAQWAYLHAHEIPLPDFPREQRAFGYGRGGKLELHELNEVGALVFVRGLRAGFLHVGICTGEDSVIHATNRWRGVSGVLEVPLSQFVRPANFRGGCRIIREDLCA